MCTSQQEGILVVDDNPIVRETLAEWLRAGGYEVATASTGERAFLMLRDERRWVGWLYTRADLPGLIDGAILADEYHDRFPGRPVVIAAADDRPPSARDVVLRAAGPGRSAGGHPDGGRRDRAPDISATPPPRSTRGRPEPSSSAGPSRRRRGAGRIGPESVPTRGAAGSPPRRLPLGRPAFKDG